MANSTNRENNEMKKSYTTPEMKEYGTIAALTGIEGTSNQTDFVFNSKGELQSETPGGGSIDADPCGEGTADPDCSNT